MPSAMFHLTRRERMLVASVLLAFLAGLAVKHHRGQDNAGGSGIEITDAKR